MGEGQLEPKISLPEAVLVGMLIALADAIEFVLVLVGLDDFWISDAVAFPATQIYLRMKGVRGTYGLVANVAELIPYAGWLPMRTIGFGITVWLDHHPKAEAAVGKAIAVAGAAAGTVPTGGAAAPTAGAAAAGKEAASGAAATGAATPGRVGAAPTGGAGVAAAGGETAAAGVVAERVGVAKEISPEALGEEKSIFEKLREPMEELPELKKKEDVELDDEYNQINLKKAA